MTAPRGYYMPPAPGQKRPPKTRRMPTGLKVFLIIGAGLFVLVAVAAALGSTVKPAPKRQAAPVLTAPAAPASQPAQAPAGTTLTYVVAGSPADSTYGPAGSDIAAGGTLRQTVAIQGQGAAYYSIQSQLGTDGGVTRCRILVNGHAVSRGVASGPYNIAQCEVSRDPLTGQWESDAG